MMKEEKRKVPFIIPKYSTRTFEDDMARFMEKADSLLKSEVVEETTVWEKPHTSTVQACIGLVTDLTTGKIDGDITQGGLISVTGHHIKIDMKDESTTNAIFLIDHQGVSTSIDTPLEKNEPQNLLFRIPPSIKTGEYILKINTRFSGNDKQPLKKICTLVYLLKLNIIS